MALALLYAAQGVPFGLAAEYLPVVLREAGFSRTQIAGLFWLQLPWQLKPLWAWIGDHPRVVPRARGILLSLQLALAATMAGYAAFEGPTALRPWLVLTVLAALLAATQDVFVDAFAVRSLGDADRGLGNSAQIAGYRVGIIVGGGGLLLLAERWGAGRTVLAAAALVLVTSLAAFALRDGAEAAPAPAAEPAIVTSASTRRAAWVLLGHMFRRTVVPVFLLALTYKLGIHAVSTLIKPMLVDAGWKQSQIGSVVVTVGTASAIAGSLLGGVTHRVLGERRALVAGALLQSVTIVPLVWAERAGLPYAPTAIAIAIEHAASGMGTTVLFAALMTATWRERAALHYTLLTSVNALAIGLGGILGARIADATGTTPALVVGAALSLAPVPLLLGWDRAAAASAGGTGDAPRLTAGA